MHTIYINKEGYVSSPYIHDATIPLEISDDQYSKIREYPFDTNWRYLNGAFVLEALLTDDALKDRRERECFRIVDNRSQMWYNRLTAEQRQELENWYKEWLDVTKTKVIPTKPEWL